MTASEQILSVTELTRRIKGVLEGGFSNVLVQGEISNFKQHSSGHLYFTLKDEGAQLSAVMWRSRAVDLFFIPQDGMKVIARGKITVYEPRGNYQIDVLQLQPAGVGELQLAFERLKNKLMTEGLFEPSHKKHIPRFPERIGIVTSPTGAAIQDIISIISRRFPAVELILYPVAVQGISAADEISKAIRDFNEYGQVDVLIVGRGGGSLEDLWTFNEEIVARSIYDSKIPIISAVGHEVDFSISDFVADLRAPTPSAAAELVVQNRVELLEIVKNFYYTLYRIFVEKISSNKERIQNLLGSYSFHKPLDLIRQYSQRLDELNRNLTKAIAYHFQTFQAQTQSLQKRIEALNPEIILRRGYTMTYKNGQIISSTKKLKVNDTIKVKFYDGSVKSRVEGRLK